MTQPTIEEMIAWCDASASSQEPDDEFMIEAIRAALTAQGLPEDRNRLPLEEIPEGIQFKSMIKSGKHDGYNVMLSGVRNGRICFFDGDAATPAEALRAAIAAAKDGAP